MKRKILIFGFYGYDNTGDEMILEGICQSLLRRDPDLSLTVLSNDPRQTEARFPVKAIYAGKRMGGIKEVWNAIKETDLFVLGGGGLLQDRERRILPFWFSRVGMARALGKKIMFWGLGVGPITTGTGKKLVRYFGNRVDMITVRDPESADILRHLGVSRPPIHVTADPALAIQTLSGISTVQTPSGKIGFCLRTWSGWEGKAPLIAAAMDLIAARTGQTMELIPLHGEQDRFMGEQVLQRMERPENVMVENRPMTASEVTQRLGTMELVVSMRLHGLILAGLQKVPFVGISYDPKVAQFMKVSQMDQWLFDFDRVETEDLVEGVLSAWNLRQQTAAHLSQVIPHLQNQADMNADLALQVLRSRSVGA